MDVLARLAAHWVDMVSSADAGLKAYLVRVGLALACALLLAIHFVRRAGGAGEFTHLRQFVIAIAGGFVMFLIPVGWVALLEPRVQATLVAVALLALAGLPYFLVSSLIRTQGRQSLARLILYGAIAIGLLFQLAVLKGG